MTKAALEDVDGRVFEFGWIGRNKRSRIVSKSARGSILINFRSRNFDGH